MPLHHKMGNKATDADCIIISDTISYPLRGTRRMTEVRTMGLIASYLMVGDDELDGMMELDDDGLVEKIEELEETNELYCMDKIWDGLHFILTGSSAGEPVEDDPLSEAIVGIHVFNDAEDAEFIGCTESGELDHIISALEKTDMDALRKTFIPSRLRRADIYPDIWNDDDKPSLWNELEAGFNGLLEFYRKALKTEMNVVVSIY